MCLEAQPLLCLTLGGARLGDLVVAVFPWCAYELVKGFFFFFFLILDRTTSLGRGAAENACRGTTGLRGSGEAMHLGK